MVAPAAELDPAPRSWVEQVTGGRVLGARRMNRWRPNYFIDVDGPDGELPMFLKCPQRPSGRGHVELRVVRQGETVRHPDLVAQWL